MAGRPKKYKKLGKDSFMMVRGFPVALRLQAKSLAIRQGVTFKMWIIGAVIDKIASERAERERRG